MDIKPVRYAEALACDNRPVRKRLGLVVLATDHTSERDYARLVPADQAGVYVTRIAFINPTTPENLRRMGPDLVQAAALILPGEPLDAICYSCTAASIIMGDEAVAASIAAGKPDVPVVTPPAAARAALQALGARRICILTPYLEETSAPLVPYFESHNFSVAGLTCFGMDDDRDMARIRPEALVKAAAASVSADAEALFISCTALRSAEVAAQIEKEIGRPVVTSNQATVWMCLRLCGIDQPIAENGRLLRQPLVAPEHIPA